MKNLMFFVLLLMAVRMNGQIKTEHLERQITLDVGALGNYNPLPESDRATTQVEVVSEQTFSGGCLGNLVRTYRFKRNGQEATFEQFITLSDKESPKFTWVPENIILTAGSELPPVKNPTYTDNSGRELNLDFEEKHQGDAIHRTWTVIDLCGNYVQHTQIVSFESQ
jgi:hypothetical protein